MSVIIKKLNAYSDYTQQDINNIINYVNTKNNVNPVFPLGMNARQRNKFIEKFGQDFVVVNNRLFYRPNPNLSLEVIPPHERTQRLQQIYNNPQLGLSLGINSFYNQVVQHYIGINRRFTTNFLKQQGDYQVGHPYIKKVNRPILSKASNERWGVDMLDLNIYRFNNDPPTHNDGYRYILLVVDYFSKKVFGRALRNKTGATIRDNLENICNQNNTYPHIIQADSEFHSLVIRNWANQHNITLIRTTSYSPTSNGLIERMNQEVWKRLRAGFIRTDSLEWVQHLQDYLTNINNQKHGKTKYTPNQIWTQGYNPPQNNNIVHHLEPPTDNMPINEVRQRIQERLVSNAEKQIQRENQNAFQIGDSVRLAMREIEGDVRHRIKDKRFKTIAVRYSPEIYTIAGIFNPVMNNFNVNRRSYYLNNPNGQMIMQGIAPKRFYQNQLVKVTNNQIYPSTIPDRQRGNQINRSIPY